MSQPTKEAAEQALREALSALADCHNRAPGGEREASVLNTMADRFERNNYMDAEVRRRVADVLRHEALNQQRSMYRVLTDGLADRTALLAEVIRRDLAAGGEAVALALPGRCPVLEVEGLGELLRIIRTSNGYIVRDLRGREVEIEGVVGEEEVKALLDRARTKAAEVGTLLERVRRKVARAHREADTPPCRTCRGLGMPQRGGNCPTCLGDGQGLPLAEAEGLAVALRILDAAIAEANVAKGASCRLHVDSRAARR